MITVKRYNEIENILNKVVVTQLSYGNFIWSRNEMIELLYKEKVTDREIKDFLDIKEIKNNFIS